MAEVKVEGTDRFEKELAHSKEEIENHKKKLADNERLLEINKKRRELTQRLNKVVCEHIGFLEPKREYEKQPEFLEIMKEREVLSTETQLRELDQEIELIKRQNAHSRLEIERHEERVKELEEKLGDE